MDEVEVEQVLHDEVILVVFKETIVQMEI